MTQQEINEPRHIRVAWDVNDSESHPALWAAGRRRDDDAGWNPTDRHDAAAQRTDLRNAA